MSELDIISSLKSLPGVILGLTVHEYAHAWMAMKLGDTTSKEMGRLSLNPLKHIDPIGFLFILFAGFGWAKPVMFNDENLKKKHSGEILISIAGPLSNLVLGILLILTARVVYTSHILDHHTTLETVKILIISGMINFGLFVFNLIPLPPLDGSHLYLTFLKVKNPMVFNWFYKYGTGILFLIIIIESQSHIRILPISPVIGELTDFFMGLFGFRIR